MLLREWFHLSELWSSQLGDVDTSSCPLGLLGDFSKNNMKPNKHVYMYTHIFIILYMCVHPRGYLCLFVCVSVCLTRSEDNLWESVFFFHLGRPTSLDLLKKVSFFSGDAGQWWNTWLVCTGPGPVWTLQIKACQPHQKLDSHFLTQLWGCSSPDGCHHSSEYSSYPVPGQLKTHMPHNTTHVRNSEI